jgi:hypothetical protein
LAQARSVVLTPSWKLSGGKYLAIRSGAAVGLWFHGAELFETGTTGPQTSYPIITEHRITYKESSRSVGGE